MLFLLFFFCLMLLGSFLFNVVEFLLFNVVEFLSGHAFFTVFYYYLSLVFSSISMLTLAVF